MWALTCGCDDADDVRAPDAGPFDALTADDGLNDTASTAGDAATCVTSAVDAETPAVQAAPALPPRVPFGLAARPQITTCLPLPKPTGADSDAFPQTLLATGCFRPDNLREAVADAIPYDVNAPLWSDAAAKRRWMVLPAGAKIKVGADGDFEFPNGTMLMKSFELDGAMLETRFLVRHSDGEWAGYTYVWDEAGGNSASLLGEASASRSVGFETWLFPSRASCLSCHTAAAGRSLGLELGQLNGDFVYEGQQRANQLATLDHIGLFEQPLGTPETLPRYANPALTHDTLEQRARAYLHSNCGHCHRPNGLQSDGELPTIDLRYQTPLLQTDLINQPPVRGAFGIPGVMLVKPGFAAQSMLVTRMKTTVANVRMPAIGSTVVDQQGVALVSAWIETLTCR